MDEETARMMTRWRNILCPEAPGGVVDREIREINMMERTLGEIPEEVNRVRALISRVDPLCYCHVFHNVDFIMNAIGALTYPGSPGIDVLERCMLRGGQLPSDVKERANEYIYPLEAWLKGRPCEEAVEERPQYAKLIRRTYSTLGDRSPYREWLAASLIKTLKEHAYTPIDWLSQFPYEEVISQLYKVVLGRAPTREEAGLGPQSPEKEESPTSILRSLTDSEEYTARNLLESVKEVASDQEFVLQVYRALLGREPSPDDLEFRVSEIRETGSRDALIRSVARSREHLDRQLARVAEALKSS